MKHTGTITIETPRLILRKFTLNDAQQMFDNYCSHEAVTEFLTWRPHKTIDDILVDCDIWAITDENDINL